MNRLIIKHLNKVGGGYTMDFRKGIFNDIYTYDFSSFYPTTILTYNISPETIITKDFAEKHNIPYIKIPADYHHVHDYMYPEKYFRKDIQGVVPKLIEKFIKLRYEKKYKKFEYKDTNPEMYKKLKAEELALKVIMNSVYGYFGFKNSRWYNPIVANAITQHCRHLTKKCIDFAEKNGWIPVYSDSVAGDTKVIIKKNNKIEEVNIKDLFENCDYKINNKEYCLLDNIEALTLDKNYKSVFKKIKYVMRHKVNKKMYRVYISNSNYIDVTEDHSLFGYLNKKIRKKKKINNLMIEVKPNELGKEIKNLIYLKYIPRENIKSKNLPKEVYKFLGYFIGNGSFGSYKKYKTYYYNISSGNDLNDIIKLINNLKEKGWIKGYTISKNRKGDIKIWGGKLQEILKECIKNNKKEFPEFIFNETNENIALFISGYFSADGTVIIRNNRPIVRLTSINEDWIKKMRTLLWYLGIPSNYFTETNQNKYNNKNTGTYSKHLVIKDTIEFYNKIGFIIKRKQEKLKNALKNKKDYLKDIRKYDFSLIKPIKIEEIEYDDYVYDIEVEETHRFFANGILAHNTDSVGLLKSKPELNEYELNEKFKEYIDKFVKRCNVDENKWLKLEYEKKIHRLVYFKKKRYASLLYEIDENGNIVGEPEIDIKGLEIIRRDAPPLGRELQKRLVIDCWLLEKITEDEFIQELYKLKEKIINGEIDDKYIIIKTGLSKPISSYGKPVIDKKTGKPKVKKDGTIQYAPIPIHVQVAKQMQDDGFEVNVGDVIHYVITKHKPKLQAIPVYKYKESKMFDKDYYWESAVKLIINVLSIINPELILKHKDLWWITPPKGRLSLEERLKRMIKKFRNDNKY